MMITGGYWGKQDVGDLFVKCIERLTCHQEERGGFKDWINLQSLPVLILLFSAALASLASENYPMLAALLLRPQNKYSGRGKEPLILSVFPSAVIEQNIGRLLPNMDRRWTPASDYLVEILQPHLREYIPEQREFEEKFDRLEYLISLVILDHSLQISSDHWAPLGRFGWKFRHGGDHHISNQIKNELDKEGENWKPLKSGFFGGSIDRVNIAQVKLIEQLQHLQWY
jgi:hypothetical protein